MAEQQVTSATDKTPEEIQKDMSQTRDSLTEKVAALENQVVGTVQTAADTVTETVEAVKSLVSQAPEAMSDSVKQAAAAMRETVKDTFDISGHVRRHPWAAVGTSMLIGCAVGLLAFRRREQRAREEIAAPLSEIPVRRLAETEPARSETKHEPGILDDVFNMLGDKAKEMARTALETVSTALKENIQTHIPQLVNDASARLTETNESTETSFARSYDARRDFPGGG